MKTQNPRRYNGRYMAAFVAAGFSYLAGTICVVTSLSPRHAAIVILGMMLIFSGSIWVVIGAKFKKDAERI
jgi:NADH:ubiquinone oxidoreductase subunit 6 (subunit J)